MKKRILRLAKKGIRNKNWYEETANLVKTYFPENEFKLVSKFLAVTSMNASLKANVSHTIKAYYQYKNGVEFTGFMPSVIGHLNKAVKGQRLTGRKVRNFADAIIGKKDAVVIDIWMLRAFNIDRNAPTKKIYNELEAAIKGISKSTKFTPRQLQASVWCGIKGKNNQLTYKEVFKSKFKLDLFAKKPVYSKKQVYIPIKKAS